MSLKLTQVQSPQPEEVDNLIKIEVGTVEDTAFTAKQKYFFAFERVNNA
jgi:hypothetical protein